MNLKATLAILLLLGWGCTTAPGPDEVETVVAYIDEQPVGLAEFDAFLDANLLEAEGAADPPPAQAASIRSRMFDRFLEELLLYREATTRNLQVHDMEIEAYLGLSDDQTLTDSAWEQARRRLLIQKLESQIDEGLPPLDETEIRRHLEENRDRLGVERRVRMRTLRLDSQALAARLHRDIQRRRITFEEALVAHGTTPDQGVPVEVSWMTLWPSQREALKGLGVGKVTQPVEMNGVYYLFEVRRWVGQGATDESRGLELAAKDLARARLRAARAGLLLRLRERSNLKIQPGALPFRYTSED